MNSAAGIRPDVLGRELEDRGFESMWLPEHSHIPVSRESAYPSGGELPEGYLHMMDPIVSLMAAASATSTLTVANGIALILEHDLLSYACATSTLAVLSGGRFVLGVGVGWNKEELANHRPDVAFDKRYGALIERIEALRTMWRDDVATFAGRWDNVTPSWVYPKPPGGSIPIAMGNAGPLGMRLAARHADVWCPIDTALPVSDGKPDVEGAITEFRSMVADEGRDPFSVSISLFSFSRPTDARMERYSSLGLERVVLSIDSAGLSTHDNTLRHLDELAPILATWRPVA